MATCTHPSCTCEAAGPDETCSDFCKQAAEDSADGGASQPHCRCGHEGCRGDVT
jgi:hypothetical protein